MALRSVKKSLKQIKILFNNLNNLFSGVYNNKWNKSTAIIDQDKVLKEKFLKFLKISEFLNKYILVYLLEENS